jgi:hypothetical protein
MLEWLLDIEAAEYGIVTALIDPICCLTGFCRRLLVCRLGIGFFLSAELRPS